MFHWSMGYFEDIMSNFEDKHPRQYVMESIKWRHLRRAYSYQFIDTVCKNKDKPRA